MKASSGVAHPGISHKYRNHNGLASIESKHAIGSTRQSEKMTWGRGLVFVVASQMAAPIDRPQQPQHDSHAAEETQQSQ